jgi:hypothetical protein
MNYYMTVGFKEQEYLELSALYEVKPMQGGYGCLLLSGQPLSVKSRFFP